MGEGDGNRARKLLLGKWPPGRGPVPEPELLGTIAPFLSGDVLERACRYAGYALWTRAYERPVGSELFRAIGAVAHKRVRKGGLEHYLDTLPDAVRSRPQPLARPTWIAAATLARIAAPWLSEHALSDLQRLGLIAWLDDDELFEVALKSGIEERAALLASLLAPRDVSDAVVSAAASAAHDLPAQNRAVLLAWSCNAARGERRREIADLHAVDASGARTPGPGGVEVDD